MDKKTLSFLLRIVGNNSDISPLRRLGYHYSQISLLISEAIKEGFLAQDNQGIKLSSSGIKFLSEYSNENKEQGIERWVLPQTDMIVTPCQKYDIILPKKMQP